MPHFAWPTFEEWWECAVVSVKLDGADVEGTIDTNHLRIDVYDREWAEVELTLTATTNESTPFGLTDLAGHVLISCPATHFRRSHPVEATARDGIVTLQGTFQIARSVVAGKVAVLVEIVAQHEDRRRVVGSAVPWALIVEKSDAPEKPGVPPLKTIWTDFGDDDAPPEARRNAGAHAFVDVAASPPILYLNRGIDGFQSLILADRPKLERRRHRDLISAFIARYVASTLFRAAVEQVTADEFGGPAEGQRRGFSATCVTRSRQSCLTLRQRKIYTT